MASNLKFEILQHLCVLSDRGNNWRREANLVRWNDGVPKFDIRDWSYDRTQMSKGITLTKNEFLNLSSNIRFVKLKLWDQLLNEQQSKAQNVSQNNESKTASFSPFESPAPAPVSSENSGSDMNAESNGSETLSAVSNIPTAEGIDVQDIPPVPEILPEEDTSTNVFSQHEEEKMASGM